MNKLRIWTSSLIVASLIGLSGCGGNSAFSVSPGSLSYSGVLGGATPPSQRLTITAKTFIPFLLILFPAMVTSAPLSGSGAPSIYADVNVESPNTIGAGTHTGSIEMTACSDTSNLPTSCYNSQLDGGRKNVAMTYTVTNISSPGFDGSQLPEIPSTSYTGRLYQFDANGKPISVQEVAIPNSAIPHLLSK